MVVAPCRRPLADGCAAAAVCTGSTGACNIVTTVEISNEMIIINTHDSQG